MKGGASVFSVNFVDYIPDEIDEHTLYVSMEFATVTHKCACGCGNDVVTPLSPTDWRLIYNGKTVSLEPSIGNWSFDCQSHYWIKNNRIRWAEKWSNERITQNRNHDRLAKDQHYTISENLQKSKPDEPRRKDKTFWERFKNFLK